MSIRPRRSLENDALQRPNALDSTPRPRELLWLDKNENLDAGLLSLTRRVLSSVPGFAVATYPEAAELYHKLGEWVGVPPECLLLTPGSDGAIRAAYETFVEAGECVIHTSPTFAMYPVYAQMFGATSCIVDYQRGAVGPRLDIGLVLEAIRRCNAKLLCLPNPDSPTGTIVARDDLWAILKRCESAGTVLLVDEAYHPFCAETVVPWVRTSENLIVARTFSKAWGAAGMRLGYAVAQPTTIQCMHKMRPMYEAGAIAIEFMVRMLKHADEMANAVARIKSAKEVFIQDMTALGLPVLRTEGNFVHVAFGDRADIVHAELMSKVLYRRSFEHPCLAGYSRFSVAGVEAMRRVAGWIRDVLERNLE